MSAPIKIFGGNMKTDNIKFFKKIYFSIFKINEYGKLSKEGLKKSIYYIMDLILICALIYASILTIKMKINANGLQEYLEQEFPELTYENNTLVSKNTERVVLNHKLVKANFGAQLIIDTATDYETLINEYQGIGESTILLTPNKYVTINSQGDVSEYNYNEIIKNEGVEQTTLCKEYFVGLLSNIPYGYYFCGYFVGSGIGTSIIIYIYNIIITIISFIFCKVKNINLKFGKIYSMGLYAHTISVFMFFLINILPIAMVQYVQVIIFLIPIVYMWYAVYTNKKQTD